MKLEEHFKIVASIIALLTALVGLFTNINSCHKKDPQPVASSSISQPAQAAGDQQSEAKEQPPADKEQSVAAATPPAESPAPPPAILGYLDQQGGFRLHPEGGLSGSQTVGSQITDEETLITIAIKNSILIEEFQNKYSAMLKFEKEANKENLQAVVDWTSFIASYKQFLEQKVSTNPDIKQALTHVDNLENYKKELNELE